MELMSLPLNERMDLLLELMSCTGKMYSWQYDASGKLLKTICPYPTLNKVFYSVGCMKILLEYAPTGHFPLIIAIPHGLMWCAVFDYDNDSLRNIFVIGPISTTELSYEFIHRALQNADISTTLRSRLINMFQDIPVASTIDFFRQTLMLHYCITGEKLTTSDIVFRSTVEQLSADEDPPIKDRMQTWMTEQALMRMISEGDLNYKNVLQNASDLSSGVQITTKDSLQQVQITEIVFISLCVRAAIQGGISPDIAYSRGDDYIQEALGCKTVADAARLGHTMYDDFIHLVHKHRTNPHFSKYIQGCCDYIDLHIEDKLTLTSIARHIGYVEYYLSRKFKAETGISIHDYIKNAKIERAKVLLLSTNLSIQDISDRLNFGSRSFFAETFKQITGIPPATYRSQNKRL